MDEGARNIARLLWLMDSSGRVPGFIYKPIIGSIAVHVRVERAMQVETAD